VEHGAQVPEAYVALQERLAKAAEGAPPADELFEILQIIFTEEEARLGAVMPMLPTDAAGVAKAAGKPFEAIRDTLAAMADKGLVVDVATRGGTLYMLAPPVIGFLEYTFMKRAEGLPMKLLAELAEKYLVEHLLPHELALAKTARTRVVPYVSAFGGEMSSEVVTYERARDLISASGGGSLGSCFCRHQAHLLGKGCDAPKDDICMGLGKGGDYLVRHGFARAATVDELLAKLDEAEELGLVHTTDNVQNRPVFMCHCCGCCCHLLRTINEFDLSTIAPSGFRATVDESTCTGCGICEERCQVGAIDMPEGIAHVDVERCLGCGVCVPTCPSETLSLRPVENPPDTPSTMMDMYMRLAAEKDRLQGFMGG